MLPGGLALLRTHREARDSTPEELYRFQFVHADWVVTDSASSS